MKSILITLKEKYGNNSKLLFAGTDSLMYESFNRNKKKKFDFSNYSTKSKYYRDSSKLEFVRLKPKVYSYLVNANSEHKKAKVVSRNIAATISQNQCKDVLLNKNCLRHSMNRIIISLLFPNITFFNFFSSQNRFFFTKYVCFLIFSLVRTVFLLSIFF